MIWSKNRFRQVRRYAININQARQIVFPSKIVFETSKRILTVDSKDCLNLYLFVRSKMKLLATTVFLLALSMIALAQRQPDNSNLRKVTPPIPIDQILKSTAAKETEFAAARNQYLYHQEVTINTIGIGNTITGQYYRVSEIVFDDRGIRTEKILKFPPQTLENLQVTNEDLAGFGAVTPFALTTELLPDFKIDYVGKEKIDELDTYAFDITPKFMLPYLSKIEKGKVMSEKEVGGAEGRSFMGRIWIDDRDLQIVKTSGKAVPESKQRFPHFDSYRENIDGKYWFPTYVYGDDTLDFGKGGMIQLRFEVKYTNYRKFSGAIELEDPVEDTSKKPKKPDKP